MKLKDRDLLRKYMDLGDFSQARLGRYAGVSRQFINQLCTGERATCTPTVAQRIEEGLRVLPNTLFAPSVSHGTGQSAKGKRTAA
ncbi:helix-turn-helix transcriptional regulator [Ornithinimicrobium sp. LYQ92]|uniref:helix-turn-helix transcriptional regulator n=1 Tax=Serinicoccus sp. LYQ92 TaxID=3378798 RepID=UPI00385284AD